MKSLRELYSVHKGKVTDKWALYLTEYERIFAPLRKQSISMLEIGIQNGGSLEIWSKYFTNAQKIIGCDIEYKCGNLVFEDPRISVVVGDATAQQTQKEILQKSHSLDLIIEDGSHISADIVKTFAIYFPLLSDGGLFIVEDLHCSYWHEFEGGVYYPYSSMNFFKLLADVVNHEHWGVAKSRSDLISGFKEKFHLKISEESLSHVHSIEFINSICIIKKTINKSNELGTRIVSGTYADVEPFILELAHSNCISKPQNNNQWSTLVKSPAESYQNLIDEIEFLKREYESLLNSNSFKVMAPLREIRRFLSSPISQLKIYLIQILRVVKRFYQFLPLNQSTKKIIRKFVSYHLPKLLILSGAHPMSVFGAGQVKPVKDLLNLNCHNFKLEDLNIQVSSKPRVSIIIPIYGNINYTLNCLASIAKNQPSASIEVIVVDDFSPDSSVEVLERIDSIRLVRNDFNLGFIKSCNRGASLARGEYLLFLNNDTQVTPGWLDELLDTFFNFDNVGLVGSKLIYPDGNLQEAGGIIWRDGTAWTFGKFQNPLAPEYNYARSVDYCSGASIMVPKDIFKKVGGFDEDYLPAYCEDSDLALKLRSMGFGVIYQPKSLVIHFEGVTSGNDTSQGIKSYQVANTRKLFDRWKDFLSSNQVAGINADQEKDRGVIRRVLVIDHSTPTPNKDAGSVTVWNLIALFQSMGFQVTFIPEDNLLFMPGYTDDLQRIGVEVLYSPFVNSVREHLVNFGSRYDLVFLFRPIVVDRHIKNIREFCNKAKVIFHTIDLHFLRMAREAKLKSDLTLKDASDEMKLVEFSAIRASDISIVHSSDELELISSELHGDSLHLFPLIINVPGTQREFSERRDIVFVGGYNHTPNVDAVIFFVMNIMPILRKKIPGICFHVVGSNVTDSIKALSDKDIIVHGFIDKLDSFLDGMRISIVPLRYGAGIKGKIGTAMALGLPTVATSLAVEGMKLKNGENILVADDPEEFAETILELYQNEALWGRISKNGIKFAHENWGSEAAWGILAGILEELDMKVERGTEKLKMYSGNASSFR